MKKLISILTALTILLSCFSITATAAEEVKVILDGELLSFDVPAQIINGRTMVPVRKIFEELGMDVIWDGDAQKVIANKKGVLIELYINSTTVCRNSVDQEIDVPAQIIENRTLVPVRVVSEYAGSDVVWDNDTRTVYITSTDNIHYINWNDTYEYYGECENGDAYGYGILYSKEDGSIRQMGKYINSQIIAGTFCFDGGDTFVGNFENARPVYGTYYYNNGDSYTGEFVNGEFSNGTYNFSNGSYHKTKWENGLPNGWGIFYDSVEDVQYEGNYIDGKRDGDFIIKDFFLNKTYYATYDNGNYVDEQYIQSQSQKQYEEEYSALIAWAEDKVDEIYLEGEKIYNQILSQGNITSLSPSGAGSNSGNIDSFAAANALRQQQSLTEQFRKTAESAKTQYIAEQLELLAGFVEQRENELKIKYNIK